jgi:acyl-CoA thioesterase II
VTQDQQQSGTADLGIGDGLAALIAIPRTGPDSFRAPPVRLPGRRNLFGGQLVAQALFAAGSTVAPDRPAHSLHAYFVKEGVFDVEVDYLVRSDRDGGSFSLRTVEARQQDRLIFRMSASFQSTTPGPTQPLSPPMPMEPTPEDLRRERPRWTIGMDVVDAGDPMTSVPTSGIWARSRTPLADHGLLRQCVIGYVSDIRVGVPAPIGDGYAFGLHIEPGTVIASLDHAVWFHRPAPATGWFSSHVVAESTYGSRTLLHGTIHDERGRHLASMTQELLIR